MSQVLIKWGKGSQDMMNQCLVCPYYFMLFSILIFTESGVGVLLYLTGRRNIEIPQWLSFCSKGTEAIRALRPCGRRTSPWSYKSSECQSWRSFPPSCHPWCVACSNSTWSHLSCLSWPDCQGESSREYLNPEPCSQAILKSSHKKKPLSLLGGLASFSLPSGCRSYKLLCFVTV